MKNKYDENIPSLLNTLFEKNWEVFFKNDSEMPSFHSYASPIILN